MLCVSGCFSIIYFLYDAGFCAAQSSFILSNACTWCPGLFCRGALLNYYDAIMTSIRMDFFFLNFPTLLLNMYAWLQVFLARGLQLEKTTKAANVQYILVLIFTPPPPPPPPPLVRVRGGHTHTHQPQKKSSWLPSLLLSQYCLRDISGEHLVAIYTVINFCLP